MKLTNGDEIKEVSDSFQNVIGTYLKNGWAEVGAKPEPEPEPIVVDEQLYVGLDEALGVIAPKPKPTPKKKVAKKKGK
jgi:hypothetical protein